MTNSTTFSGKPPSNYKEVPFRGELPFVRSGSPRKLILLVQLASFPIAFVFGIVFFMFAFMFGKPPKIAWDDAAKLPIIMIGLLLLFVLHELIHGLVMRAFGAQPKYGVKWKEFSLYASARGYPFSRNQCMMSALAPIVILSIVSCLGILIQAGTFYVWGWALWATANAGSSTGDLGVAVLLLRYPKNAFIVDDQAGARVFLPPYEDRIT